MFVKCLVETCESPKFSYGYCMLHANRFRRYGDPLVVKKAANHAQSGCSMDGCDRPFYGKGMCKLHYTRTVTGKSGLVAKPCEMCGKQTERSDAKFCSASCRVKWHRKFGCYRAEKELETRGPCSLEGCDKVVHANGLCRAHAKKLWKYGDPLEERPSRLEPCSKCGTECTVQHSKTPVCRKCYAMHYYYLNHGQEKSRRSARRARTKLATPKWANLEMIAAFYDACPEGDHVDHIVPLRGRKVSGLHTLENLQYLSAQANFAKRNRHSD